MALFTSLNIANTAPDRPLANALRLLDGLNRTAVLRLAGRRRAKTITHVQGRTENQSGDDPHDDLEALARLDPEAITRIHDRYFEEIYRFARYRLSDDVLAEDVAAECFKRLLEYTHRGRGPTSHIRGWLMRTASNLVNDYYRAMYNHPTEELPETLPAAKPGPVSMFEASEEKQELHEALKTLTEEQVNVLALRFGSGLSLAETAKALGKKTNAIKALQFRAINALRRELTTDGG